jgi:hypothetical protein
MHGNGNPNWQDKLLGGIILGGFVMVAIIAGRFSLVTRGAVMAHAIMRPRGRGDQTQPRIEGGVERSHELNAACRL